MKKKIPLLCLPAVFLLSCGHRDQQADAYGNFEADDIVISSEATGKLIRFAAEEGMSLQAGDTIALVDTTQAYLAVRQLAAAMEAIREKLPDKALQLAVYDEQIRKLQQDEQRSQNLVTNNAAPQKQLDDIKAELDIIRQQKNAATSSLNVQTKGLLAEMEPLRFQLLQAEDRLRKCYIVNPVNGMVLSIFVRQHEVVEAGRPLYDIAPVNPIILRAYITETQLTRIKAGDSVQVKTDASSGGLRSSTGRVTEVSSEAEFTPKIIQTREERANLVYAVKIKVPNDGTLKIGMPAEVYFNR